MLNLTFQTDKVLIHIQKIKEILFPKRCVFCFKEGLHLCKDHNTFPKFSGSSKKLISVDILFIACNYQDKRVKRVIECFKFKNFTDLGIIFSKKIFQNLKKEKSQEFFKDFVITPIPLHWTRKLWRGYNQSEILANHLQKHLRIPTKNNLVRKQKTKQQAKLSKIERLENLVEVFEWKNEEIPEKIILVDDICTTGATLEAAAKALKNAGAKKVIGAVFAGGK